MRREIGFNLLLCFLLISSVVFSMASLGRVGALEARMSVLQQQVQAAEESAKLREAEAREDVKATYQLLTGMASRWRLTSNMQVEPTITFQHTRGPTWAVPNVLIYYEETGRRFHLNPRSNK